MKSAPSELRRRVHATFEGQLYDPDSFLHVASKTDVDWAALEEQTVDFYNRRLASVMTPDEQARVADVNYMTAPSNVLNAMILRDATDVVIVFNLSMQSLLSLYVEWFMAACEATRVRDEAAMGEASCRLVQIVELGVTGHSPTLFPHGERFSLFSPTSLPPEARQMIEVCTHVAQLFVVGHELGHLVLGHIDDERKWGTVAPQSQIERLNESQQMERDADVYGLQLVARFHDIPSIGTAFALVSVFSMFAVGEFVASLVVQNSADSDASRDATHPDATDRIRIARDYIPDAEGLEWFDLMWQISEFVSDFAWREHTLRQPAG